MHDGRAVLFEVAEPLVLTDCTTCTEVNEFSKHNYYRFIAF